MTHPLSIGEIRFTPARQEAIGLLGFVSFKLARALIIDGVAVRRSLDGRIVLVFPERTDRSGVQHPYIRPLDQAAREAITEQVVARLQALMVLP